MNKDEKLALDAELGLKELVAGVRELLWEHSPTELKMGEAYDISCHLVECITYGEIQASYTVNKIIESLRQVCSEAYQMAGALGADADVLDNLLAASCGEELPHETFLPVFPKEDQDASEDLSVEISRLEDEISGLKGALRAEHEANIMMKQSLKTALDDLGT